MQCGVIVIVSSDGTPTDEDYRCANDATWKYEGFGEGVCDRHKKMIEYKYDAKQWEKI